MKPALVRPLLVLPLLLALVACDYLGIDDPAKIAASKEADAKAVGGACRNAGRAIEDCYVLNPKADKAAVLAGWREMDEYMRDNKLQGIAPAISHVASAPGSDADASDDSTPSKGDAKTDSKTDSKADAKTDMKPDPKAAKADKKSR